jgi:hypothetical protein
MAEHVTTFSPRITFVKGWVTGGIDPADGSVECGDGTDFPMLVTLDQLAEIMYRVKKAKISTGGFTANGTLQIYYPNNFDVPEYTFEHTVTAQLASGEPPENSLSITAYGDDNVGVVHGVSVPTRLVYELGEWVEGNPPVRGSGRLSMEDSNSINYFESRYINGSFPFYGDGGYLAAREVINEISLFSELQLNYSDCHSAFNINCGGNASDPPNSSLSSAYGLYLNSSDARTLIFRGDPTWPPSTDTFYAEKIDNDLIVGNAVAYTGESLTDPNGKIYIFLNFDTSIDGGANLSKFFIRSKKTSFDKQISTTLTLGLKLSGGQIVICPLYAYVPDYQSNANVIVTINTLTFSSQVNFVFEATEWWPYQDDNGNVWSPTTGLPV